MKETELKPCPFCGGKANLIENHICGGKDYSYVTCESCHVRTQQYTVSVRFCPNDEATKAWNRRSDDGRKEAD